MRDEEGDKNRRRRWKIAAVVLGSLIVISLTSTLIVRSKRQSVGPAAVGPAAVGPAAVGPAAVGPAAVGKAQEYAKSFILSQTIAGTTTFDELDLVLVQTYTVDTGTLFDGLADTYDNALALFFLTVTGEGYHAQRLADSWVRLVVRCGWNPAEVDTATSIAQMSHILNARYRVDGSSTTVDLWDVTYVEDVGNNSYMAMALAKFGQTYFSTDPDNIYVRAARGIGAYIERTRYSGGTINGYAARARATMRYLSTEHHIDMYALGTILADPTIVQHSRTFLDNLYDSDEGVYRIGTTVPLNGVVTINTGDATPVDCQTWTILAGVNDTTDSSRQQASMEWVVSNCVVDDALTDVGCSPSGVGAPPCDPSSDNTFRGVRFTDRGKGIQLENTGSGLMALLRLRQRTGTTAFDASIEAIQESLHRLIQRTGDVGMCSSFRKESAYPNPANERNTGLGWSYWRIPHVASTVYCALALMYDDRTDDLFNPYSTTILPQTDHTLQPVTIQPLGYSDIYTSSSLTRLPANEDIGQYYGYFLEKPDWFQDETSAYTTPLCTFLHITKKDELTLIDKNPWLANQPDTTRVDMVYTLFTLLRKSQ